jgi:hypothetical protein
MLASCGNKYYGTHFVYAVPSSLLVAPGLQTIQFLLYFFFGYVVLSINLCNLQRSPPFEISVPF